MQPAFIWTSTKNEWSAQNAYWSRASLVIWSRVFWLSVTWNLRKAQRWSKSVLTSDRWRLHSLYWAHAEVKTWVGNLLKLWFFPTHPSRWRLCSLKRVKGFQNLWTSTTFQTKTVSLNKNSVKCKVANSLTRNQCRYHGNLKSRFCGKCP